MVSRQAAAMVEVAKDAYNTIRVLQLPGKQSPEEAAGRVNEDVVLVACIFKQPGTFRDVFLPETPGKVPLQRVVLAVCLLNGTWEALNLIGSCSAFLVLRQIAVNSVLA